MIKKEEVYKIGVINKPHGIKGEVSFTFNDDIFDRVECDYLVLLLDGILVPFFIEEYRFRSDDVALVKFEGIETAERARMLTNVEVYFPKKYMDEKLLLGISLRDFRLRIFIMAVWGKLLPLMTLR